MGLIGYVMLSSCGCGVHSNVCVQQTTLCLVRGGWVRFSTKTKQTTVARTKATIINVIYNTDSTTSANEAASSWHLALGC